MELLIGLSAPFYQVTLGFSSVGKLKARQIAHRHFSGDTLSPLTWQGKAAGQCRRALSSSLRDLDIIPAPEEGTEDFSARE